MILIWERTVFCGFMQRKVGEKINQKEDVNKKVKWAEELYEEQMKHLYKRKSPIQIVKVDFFNIFKPKGMFNQIHLYSNLSRLFFILSLTPLKEMIPVKYTSYLLIDEGKAVGTCYIIQSGKRAELTISIDEKYRHKGYGSKLVTKTLEENKHKTEIFIRVHKDNKIADNFFRKNGFGLNYYEMKHSKK